MRKNHKGFTLAELLIVIAIIGVLVAISIPIFTTQKKKAILAVNQANARSAYAVAMAELNSAPPPLEKGKYHYYYVYDNSTGTITPGKWSKMRGFYSDLYIPPSDFSSKDGNVSFHYLVGERREMPGGGYYPRKVLNDPSEWNINTYVYN